MTVHHRDLHRLSSRGEGKSHRANLHTAIHILIHILNYQLNSFVVFEYSLLYLLK